MLYRSPVSEYLFHMTHVVGISRLSANPVFRDATPETCAVVLGEAARVIDETVAPLRRRSDVEPASLENGVVRSTPGMDRAYSALAEGGWIGLAADQEYGGLGLPQTINLAVNEMLSGACLALQVKTLLSQGQIEALQHHALDDLKRIVLPKLISGRWSGTMNLTEPQAGSDVGGLSARAVPNADGSFAVSGQKIFISWGDSDLVENVCHLVLARTPGAPAGTRGISLFLVPRQMFHPDGRLGAANSVRVVSLEHKLGLHGSPTAVLSYDGATGWMIGEEYGGMSAMFTMMNSARLGVGAQGIGIAEAACQCALAYAAERRQGRAGGIGTIVEHPDVRRMLATMKAELFAARATAFDCAFAVDMARATEDPVWAARAQLLIPIAKVAGTEAGIRIADTSIQVHGGPGYIEESGVAQLWRDVRVTSIYEGTNGIQAIDLVGRKLEDGGDAMMRLIRDIAAGAEAARSFWCDGADAVGSAARAFRDCTDWMLSQDVGGRLPGALPYLRGAARVLGAHYHLQAARTGGEERKALARVYLTRMLPGYAADFAEASAGGDDLAAIATSDLVA